VANDVPNTYIKRVERPLGINPVGAPLGICMIGTGSRTKRVTDEAVVKGLVEDEAVVPATFTMPHVDIAGSLSELYVGTFANRAVRDEALVTISRTMNGNVSVLNPGRNDWAFLPAFVTPASSLPGPFATTATVGSSFSLDIDGMSMTIIIIDDAGASVTVDGHNVTVGLADNASADAITLTEAVAAVNLAVSTYALAQGISVDYSACAVAGTNGLTIYSQIEGPDSDVRVFAGFANNLNTLLFGGPLNASTRVQLSVSAFGSGATFEVNYVAAVDAVDALANVPTTLRTVGSAAGRGDYVSGEDFTASGANLTWTPAAATLTSTVPSTRLGRTITSTSYAISSLVHTITTTADHGLSTGDLITFDQPGGATGDIVTPTAITVTSPTTFTTVTADGDSSSAVDGTVTLVVVRAGVNDSFAWAIDGHPLRWVDLIAPAASPYGFVTATVQTQAELVVNLNAHAVRDFGPRYLSTASVVTVAGFSVIRLTSYLTGSTANIALSNSVSTGAIGTAAVQAAAVLALFGADVSAAPAEATIPAASAPAQGDTYYVSYDYARPTTEYLTRYSFTDASEARAHIGVPSADVAGYNPLAVALEIADQMGASEYNFIQINDAISAGSPTISEIQDALAEAELEEGNTEIVLVGAAGNRSDAWAEVLSHVEDQSGAEENHPRRGYCGAASSTLLGTVNEEGTLLFAPARVFQVSPESQGRGRMFFCVGPKRSGAAVQFDTRLDDGNSATLDLDHTYVAVAAAAWRVSRTSAADSMTNEFVNGVFRVPTKAESWNSRELKRLIRGSCLVLASNGGQLKWVEGLTTERAGAAAASFEIDTGTVQDDLLRLKIKTAMDRSLIGVEPASIATFLFDCKVLLKSIIEGVISGKEAGEYLNPDGSARELDMDRDISFKSVANDPRRYRFTYSANRRYAVGVIEGSYTPDVNLFASLASSGV